MWRLLENRCCGLPGSVQTFFLVVEKQVRRLDVFALGFGSCFHQSVSASSHLIFWIVENISSPKFGDSFPCCGHHLVWIHRRLVLGHFFLCVI